MWRSAVLLLAVSVSGIGCGGVGDFARTDRSAIPECPAGTPFVRARDIVGRPAPAAYTFVRGDQEALRGIADQVREQLGAAWRGYDAGVLLRKGKAYGAAVIVVNAKERTDDDTIVNAIERSAREQGVEAEPLSIAGRDGRLVQATDGGYVATAPARRCAIVYLVADAKYLVTATAAVIPDE